jgi:hypothetical protein
VVAVDIAGIRAVMHAMMRKKAGRGAEIISCKSFA